MTATEIDTTKFIYGWGRTKHIADPVQPEGPKRLRGLCGAEGGYYRDEPQRPVCKRCARMVGQETAEQQIERLARFIMDEVPGEPSQSEGAVDCAIRLLSSRVGVSENSPNTETKP